MTFKTVILFAFMLLMMIPFSLMESSISLENRYLEATLADNQNGLIGIFVSDPITVEEAETDSQVTFTFVNNYPDCLLSIEDISPAYSSSQGFEAAVLSFDSGLLNFGDQYSVSMRVTGKEAGNYEVFYEVEVNWLTDQGEVVGVGRIYRIVVEVVVTPAAINP